MKFLTAPYLTLMHAFASRVPVILKECGGTNLYSKISLMQEYCTLRLDGGRQSGKTEAVSMFARDWIDSGKQVIVLAENQSYANSTRQRIQRNKNCFVWTIRGFLSDACKDRFRGIDLSNVLIIIDEPCSRMPEIYKFYKAFDDNLLAQAKGNLPLFFVLGIQ